MQWNQFLHQFRSRTFQTMPPIARPETFRLRVVAETSPDKLTVFRAFLSECMSPVSVNPNDPGNPVGQMSPAARVEAACKRFVASGDNERPYLAERTATADAWINAIRDNEARSDHEFRLAIELAKA